MIEDRIIICIASNWHYDPTSKHHVMRVLSRRNKILWVNYHGSRRPRPTWADMRSIGGKLRQFVEGPRQVSENITVLTPMIVPGGPSRINCSLLVRQIRNILRRLPARPIQTWSFAPDVDFLIGRFDEEAVVYYCVDEFSEFAGYDRDDILSAERRMAERADLLITTSTALYDRKRSLNANTVLVSHGVDALHFEPTNGVTTIPDDIKSLPRPILGFWGMISDWVDVPLIKNLATSKPNWTIALIGEVSTDVSQLRNTPNVHLLGRRSYAQLPSYARAFDAGLIPFLLNDLTRAVNPIKVHEYLCAGLPVVSTPLPEVIGLPGVRIAQGAQEFECACAEAIDHTARHKRRPFPCAQSWESKVDQISELVLQLRRGIVVCSPGVVPQGSRP